jgi:hypothetical protein
VLCYTHKSVRPFLLLTLCCLAASVGCHRWPEWYALPEQRPAFTGYEPSPVVSRLFKISDPNVAEYLVKDVAGGTEGGAWRWVFKRPEFRFLISDHRDLRFFMEFALPDQTFKQTGPVTFSIFINEKPFKKLRFTKPGQLRLEEPVPMALLKPYAVNHVRIEVDPVWVAPGDGAQLGFILASAGFVK